MPDAKAGESTWNEWSIHVLAELVRLNEGVKKIDTLEKRVAKLEAAVSLLKWGGGIVSAILVALAIAYLRQILGLS